MSDTQLDKRYGNDWAKSKSRDLVRGMIQRSLGYKKPKDLKVLCFPGNEAAEVREVYDPLGIPRGNIVGVERDPKVAEMIRSQGLGIQVVNQTLEDYIASQDSLGFDVVSLDYSGPLNSDQLKSLTTICKKQKTVKYVVHHANLAKRDGENTLDYIISGRLATQTGFSAIGGRNIQQVKDDVLKSFQRGPELDGEESTKEYRPLAYSIILRNLLAGGEVGNMQLANEIREFVIEPLGEEDRKKYSQVEIHEFITIHMMDAVCRALARKGFRDRLLSHSIAATLSPGFFPQFSLIRSSKMYSYVSESGDPMIGDIYVASVSQNHIL